MSIEMEIPDEKEALRLVKEPRNVYKVDAERPLDLQKKYTADFLEKAHEYRELVENGMQPKRALLKLKFTNQDLPQLKRYLNDYFILQKLRVALLNSNLEPDEDPAPEPARVRAPAPVSASFSVLTSAPPPVIWHPPALIYRPQSQQKKDRKEALIDNPVSSNKDKEKASKWKCCNIL